MAIPGNLLSLTTETVSPDLSGWAAVENCTISSTSFGSYLTSLTLTSTAAGEMQAHTAFIYHVTAGQTYATFADASSATQPERIGIDWIGASGASLGAITWSLTTASASLTQHRISVAGVAPSAARFARVVVSATATAAGRMGAFAGIYLGAPVRTPGNLLSFIVESCGDLDTSGWTPDVNAAISRRAPAVEWPPDVFSLGGEVIAATAVAAGTMAVRAAETPTVQPGREYMGACYLSPPTSTAACWVELRWLDSSGALISAVRAPLAQPGTDWYQQRVSGVAPETAAACTLAAGVTSAAAGAVLSIEGAIVTIAPEIAPGSVLPYADASFEQGVGSWTVGSGPATIARSSPWGDGFDGGYDLLVTSATTAPSVLVSGRYPVVPGVNWRSSIFAFIDTTTAANFAPNLRFFDASGTQVGLSAVTPDTVPPQADVWWQVFDDIAAPDTAATAQLEVTVTPGAASTVIEIDAVSLFQTLPAMQVTASAALGNITIVLRDLDITQLLTLYRLVGGTQTLVRGPDGPLLAAPLTGTQFTVQDYEAPLGVAVTYRADFTWADDGTDSGMRLSDPATIPVDDPSLVWIKDPQQPQRNVQLRASVAPDWTRDITQSVNLVRGRPNPVVLSDVRQGNAGTLQVWTMSDTERQALDFALDPGDVLLIQCVPGLGIDDTYVAVGQSTQARVVPGIGQPRRLWSLPITQVDAPIGGIGGTAGWSVQDVIATWPTVLDVIRAYATVLDLALDNRES